MKKGLLCAAAMATCLIPSVTIAGTTAQAKGIARTFPIVYHSCQGEGCDCAKSTVALKDVTLHAEMSMSSREVGVLRKGQEAGVLESNTIVKTPGRATLTKVGAHNPDLKVGDEIQLVLYRGEGAWLVWHKAKELELNETEEISWKVISKPITEGWYKLGAGTIEGFTQEFPFEGCLE